jgi:hypothetical protein
MLSPLFDFTSNYFQGNSEPNDEEPFLSLFTIAIGAIGFVVFVGYIINRYFKQLDANYFTIDISNNKSPELSKLENQFISKGFFIKETDGKSLIFVNHDMPQILIKHPGVPVRWDPLLRHNHQHQIKQFIERKKFKHLIVPQTKVEEDYLIEEKLPINGFDIREQIELYTKHIDSFTAAAEEFTQLLFMGSFTDLLGGYWGSLSPTAIPRYDNALLYLERGYGKIGLIDVESLYINSESGLTCENNEETFEKCKIAVTFFPYHLNQIITQAEKFDKNISKRSPELEDIQEKILVFFDIIYGAHAIFLQHHNITEKNATILFDANPILEEEITHLLINKYDDSMNEFSSKTSYKDNELDANRRLPQNELLKFKFFPIAVKETLAFNKKRCEYALAKENNLKTKSILNIRKSIFGRDFIPFSKRSEYDPNEKLLPDVLKRNLSEMNITFNTYFLEWLMDSIYEIFVNKQLIAGLHRGVYGGQDCVFF